ncbi:unnamed protein product [Brugia timori]|uniref:Transmembrane protein n=1 Tax=Brugia timori TaxID=42155 RepID=A0A0R3QEU1_9BILA|nr:unnamed protein product [Brugia timori]
MDKLSIVIESLTKPRYEEDFVDRLNYHITTLILLIAAFTIIAKIVYCSTLLPYPFNNSIVLLTRTLTLSKDFSTVVTLPIQQLIRPAYST